jgi:hypothetical protein
MGGRWSHSVTTSIGTCSITAMLEQVGTEWLCRPWLKL